MYGDTVLAMLMGVDVTWCVVDCVSHWVYGDTVLAMLSLTVGYTLDIHVHVHGCSVPHCIILLCVDLSTLIHLD